MIRDNCIHLKNVAVLVNFIINHRLAVSLNRLKFIHQKQFSRLNCKFIIISKIALIIMI